MAAAPARTAADLLVACLEAEGCEYVFSVPGEETLDLLEAWDMLEVGGVVVNDDSSYRVDNMPYGGVKDSGLGREGIRFAMEDMTEIRNLVIRRV